MIHIVFQQADTDVLKDAIKLDDSLAGDIIIIKDDFGVGPLENIYETEGYQNRRNWWSNVLENSPYAEQLNIVDDKLTVHNLIKTLEEDAETQAWIWMGQNQHDVCGYYWLISQLKDFYGRIYILYLNNLPFINDKGNIFYPTALHEIQPKEFLKAKRLARPVTTSEFEVDADEWKKICNENAGVRILEGGKKIMSKEYDFYDKDILNALTAEPQKLNKVLNNIFSKMKIKTGDVFLVWRMREMMNAATIEMQGDWNKGWKEITVRLTAVNEPIQNA